MKGSVLYCLVFFICIRSSAGQDCPTAQGWVANADKCYKFSNYPRLNYQDAVVFCQNDGATLLSVNANTEDTFVKNYLLRRDKRKEHWWTSGRTDEKNVLYWEGDGTRAAYTGGWITPLSRRKKEETRNLNVAYRYDGVAGFGWDVSDRWVVMSFVCEISKKHVYKISQERRDFSYGLKIQNPSDAPRGPYFLAEPQSVTILGRTTQVYFDCVADGNPTVKFEWMKLDVRGNMVPVPLNDRYSTVSGRLNILNPDTNRDQGTLQCKVSNKFGSILSSPVELNFGSISNFSTVASGIVDAEEHRGAQLECPPITGKPGLTYQWFKNSPTSFIRPDFQKHTFLSASGKLLFSEVSQADNGLYYCIASLTGLGLNRNYIGSSQVASKQSKGFRLNVRKTVGNNFNVDIQKDFIYVYPSTPMKGSTIRLECFAYGSTPLTYTWGRKNRPLPEGRHRFLSVNRILVIYRVDLSDDDEYFCNVTSSKSNSKQSTSLDLKILAKPYFLYPLKHQHVDVGTDLTWHCEAMGRPFPTYTWYKNGKVLTSSPGVTVVGNTLSIQNLNTQRDNGMYQCGAKNDFGESITTAQLRVLEIKPSFEGSPMTKLIFGALGGNLTITCNPIGAPRPTFTWFRNEANLNLNPGVYQPEDHYRLLLNGDLVIIGITRDDIGRFKCSVENSGGTAEDYTDIQVNERSEFYRKPDDDKVEVNMTVTLLCQASRVRGQDMIYVWSFNGHVINFEKEPEYRLGVGHEEGFLYVIGVQFRNEGSYTCAIVSAGDRQEASCYLTVLGPPGEPAGVTVHDRLEGISDEELNGVVLATTRWVTWLDGATNGDNINYYFVQFNTEFDKTWRIHPDGNNIPVSSTLIENKQDLHYARLQNLKAGAGMQFRVLARNAYGIGTPSIPTKLTQIEGAIPSEVVTNIRGGGGKIGDLTIWWNPLPREDHNGKNLEYIIRWRKYRSEGRADKWEEQLVKHDTSCHTETNIEMGSIYVCQFVKLVGMVNFYTKYEVTIQTKNEYGDGPTTQPAIVMSAELLPQIPAANVYGKVFNATALNITWTPVANNRESAGGILKGYKINYWRMNYETELEALQNIIELKPGQKNLGHGLIIGLEPVTWYKFNIQAYNLAGNGLKSSDNVQQTLNRVPEKFPTEVYVYSIEGKGVRVRFRGVSTQAREEPLRGYKVQVWKTTENIRAAREYDFGKANSGVIRNLNSSELYQLRVFAYSRAGQGKRSSPTVYFTVGDGQILANPETTEIMAGVSNVHASVVLALTVAIFSLLAAPFS